MEPADFVRSMGQQEVLIGAIKQATAEIEGRAAAQEGARLAKSHARSLDAHLEQAKRRIAQLEEALRGRDAEIQALALSVKTYRALFHATAGQVGISEARRAALIQSETLAQAANEAALQNAPAFRYAQAHLGSYRAACNAVEATLEAR